MKQATAKAITIQALTKKKDFLLEWVWSGRSQARSPAGLTTLIAYVMGATCLLTLLFRVPALGTLDTLVFVREA